jgi:hypothetical protein
MESRWPLCNMLIAFYYPGVLFPVLVGLYPPLRFIYTVRSKRFRADLLNIEET